MSEKRERRQEAEGGVFTREQAALWAGNRGARLNALLKRAVNHGEVWRIRTMIAELHWAQARRDVQRFVKSHELPSLELSTPEYFLQQCAKLGEG